MKRLRNNFVCTECEYSAPNWLGKCPDCNEWNTIEEKINLNEVEKVTLLNLNPPEKISNIIHNNPSRLKSGFVEFDRALGNGVTQESITLIGGAPGVGKSTLLMEVSAKMLEINDEVETVLYISGEESRLQVSQRYKRLGLKKNAQYYLLTEVYWQNILEQLKLLKPNLLIIDSIQTTISNEVNSCAGSIPQIREVIYELMNYSKSHSITCFVVGHINKEGSLAGPKVIEHMVDTVLYFEGEEYSNQRVLRVEKNRFGSCVEVGIFEINASGIKDLNDSSPSLIINNYKPGTGKVLNCVMEASRPHIIEVQSLVVENIDGASKRTIQGFELNRLSMLMAVMNRIFNLKLNECEIHLNIPGRSGLEKGDCDFSIVASLFAAIKNIIIPSGVTFLGEVGLNGEVGKLKNIRERLVELDKNTFSVVFISDLYPENLKNEYKLQIKRVSSIKILKKEMALFN